MKRKKTSTLTLRLNPEQTKKLNKYKESVRIKTSTDAILHAINVFPDMATKIKNQNDRIRYLTETYNDATGEVMEIKEAIKKIIKFAR